MWKGDGVLRTDSRLVSVLIVEYGYFNNDPAVSRPSGGTWSPRAMFNLTSVEQTELNGYEQNVLAACCVGGGSTIVRSYLL